MPCRYSIPIRPHNDGCYPQKKHGPKTVLFLITAPERSRTNAVSPAVQQHSENGGNTGGNIASNSSRCDHFAALLKEWGFSGTQLVLISDAMNQAGLKFRAVPQS